MRVYFCRKIKTGDSLFKQRLSPNKLINLIPFFIKNKNNRKTSYIVILFLFAFSLHYY